MGQFSRLASRGLSRDTAPRGARRSVGGCWQRSPEYDWQLIKASPERDGRECQVGGFDRQAQVGESGDEVGDRDASFHPGEVGAQAEVRSFAKRDVVIRV